MHTDPERGRDAGAHPAGWERIPHLGPADIATLAATRPERERVVDRLLAEFYADVATLRDVEEVLREHPERLQRLKELHREHFLALDGGAFEAAPLVEALGAPDESLPDRRTHWYLSFFSVYLAMAVAHLMDAMQNRPDVAPTVAAVIKALMMDLFLAIETHIGEAFVPRQKARELERSLNVAIDRLKTEQDVARSRDDLVHMLVHDLRNPVHGIAMEARVALEVASKSLDMERTHLAKIERSCNDLSRLLQDLLDIARLETGSMPVALERFPLADVVNDELDGHVPMIQRAGMHLTRVVSQHLPAIQGDPWLLRRVFMNLIVNAVQHSGSPEIRVEATEDANAVAARVIDYGEGIPDREQERIFQKFERGTSSRGLREAAGLGLYFCRLATERMGGRLGVRSRPGLTVFEVRLPTP